MAKQDLGKNVWYDPDMNGYIGLDVTTNITSQPQLNIDGVLLLPKDEYHCSLVAVRQYAKDLEKEQEIADAVQNYLLTHDLHFVSLAVDRYICQKDNRTTVIAPIEITGIGELRAFVATLVSNYQAPFSHVTLLKSEATEFGIGINSMADLDQLCRKLN